MAHLEDRSEPHRFYGINILCSIWAHLWLSKEGGGLPVRVGLRQRVLGLVNGLQHLWEVCVSYSAHAMCRNERMQWVVLGRKYIVPAKLW